MEVYSRVGKRKGWVCVLETRGRRRLRSTRRKTSTPGTVIYYRVRESQNYIVIFTFFFVHEIGDDAGTQPVVYKSTVCHLSVSIPRTRKDNRGSAIQGVLELVICAKKKYFPGNVAGNDKYSGDISRRTSPETWNVPEIFPHQSGTYNYSGTAISREPNLTLFPFWHL